MKGLLYFLGGAAVGFGACYAIFRKKFDEQYEADIEASKEFYQDSIDELRDKYEKALDEAKNGLKTGDSKGSEEVSEEKEENDPIKRYKRRKEDEKKHEEIVEKTDYAACFKPKNKKGKEVNNVEPVVITDEEYYVDAKPNINRTFTYFSENDVIVDADTGEEVPEGFDIIGRDNLDKFGESGEEGVLYVRNDLRGIDAMVVLETAEYDGDSEL